MAGWSGLVTNASPYALPDGAAAEQTNLNTLIPGQLTSRDGMRSLAFTQPPTDSRDCYPYVNSTASKMLVLTSTGTLVALDTPAPGVATPDAQQPTLSPSSGQVVSNYIGTFYDHSGEPPT